MKVVHARATHVDRVAPLSTLRAALSAGLPDAHSDFDVGHLTALRQIREQLVGLASDQGVLVCLDDFHHADDATALALRVLVPGLVTTPVLWLLSLRPAQASAAVRGVVDVLLDAGAQLLPALADRSRRRGAVRTRAPGRTRPPSWRSRPTSTGTRNGSCALHEAGTSGRGRDGLAGRRPAPAAGLAGRRRPCRAGRPRADRHGGARRGAVLGRAFTVHEAAALMRKPVSELLRASAQLVETGVLSPGSGGLAFRSELVRRVVYAGLAEPVRVALHREAAEVVSAEGRPAEEVVHHLERGGRRGSLAVVETLRRAVRDRVGGTQQAADLAVRLLDLVGDDHPAAPGSRSRRCGCWPRPAGPRRRGLAVRELDRVQEAETETRLVCALGELADGREPGGDHVVVEYARRASARLDLAEQDRRPGRGAGVPAGGGRAHRRRGERGRAGGRPG
ncbi:hypothetical protein BBK82_37135 [Lentzea guizhouensis]|uniref:Orc1-like AAA ATPase domain-containing protein n=1 Tax=Lentzea guizhouensis TaxID=1586287 RepID=A0A1B2HSX4_9PSEU|nr:hypothetical protein BBK82_37135 [Lentzea guizhouensis]